jgi:hypothetical protein
MAEAFRTRYSVSLLLAILPPLQRIAYLLEIELDKAERDLLNFYRYFDVSCQLLLNNLGRVHSFASGTDLEQYASRILERLECHLDYPNVPLYRALVSL